MIHNYLPGVLRERKITEGIVRGMERSARGALFTAETIEEGRGSVVIDPCGVTISAGCGSRPRFAMTERSAWRQELRRHRKSAL
jgi:hypothetical protein